MNPFDGITTPTRDDVEVLLITAAAGALLLAAAGLAMRRTGGAMSALAALLGAAAAVAVHAGTWMRLHGWRAPWPPEQSTERGAWAVAFFALAAVPVVLLRRTTAWSRVIAFGATAGLVALVLQVVIIEPDGVAVGGSRWVNTGDFLIWIAAAMALGALLEDAARRHVGAAYPLTLGLILGLLAQISLEYQAALVAQLFGAAALACLVAGVFGRWLFARGFPAAAALAISASAVALTIEELTFNFGPPAWWLLALPWLAVPLLEIGSLPKVRDKKAGVLFVLRMALVLIFLGVVFYLALDARPPVPDDVPAEYR